MEIAIQTPMLDSLLGMLFISPWESRSTIPLLVLKAFIYDRIWLLCSLFCSSLVDFEAVGEQRLFVGSFLALFPQAFST